jgi:hypothetical protein
MLPLPRLALEVVVIGLLALALGAIIQHLTALSPLWTYFALGAGLHLGFEVLGLNHWYCVSRASLV